MIMIPAMSRKSPNTITSPWVNTWLSDSTSEVTRVISSNLSVNIHSLNISGGEGFFKGQITVEIRATFTEFR